MRYGITFYPDQWPESYWDEAFNKIKELGFELVRFNEMTWPLLEPHPGKFDFAWLDRAMDLCNKYGLKVVLGTGAVQAPQWLVKKHHDILPVANDGEIHPPYGPRFNFCRDNRHYRHYASRLLDKIAKRYFKHPALEMWQLDNEPAYPPLDLTGNKDWCHCKATVKAFQAWCKKRYKKIDALNQAWGTKFWSITFSSFKEVSPPKGGMWEGGNPHIYLDWFRFKSESLSNWLMHLKKIICKYDKQHKIGTNSFTSIPNRIPDHETLSSGLDWFGWDIYPAATQNSDESLSQIADYWRSLCKRNTAEFVVSELQAGQTVRWGDPRPVSGEDIKNWVKILVDRGATTILFHNLRPPLFGCEAGGYGLLANDGAETERSRAAKEIISSNSLVPKPINPDIGIVYLKSSEIETYQEEGLNRGAPPGWFSGRGHLGLLFSQNSIAGAYKFVYPGKADFIFEKQLEEAKVLPYKTLLLTDPYLLSDKQFENLKSFVENGGILISDSRFGLKDKMGFLREVSLFEKWLSAKGGSASGGKLEYLRTEIIPNKIRLKEFSAEAEGFRDILENVDENEIRARFEDGYPALIEKKIGKGKVIYAAFSLFASLRNWENRNLLEFIKEKTRGC